MKNIHVIPTDKPSRLCFRNYFFINKDDIGAYSDVKFQNIYITSDEEIKEGDWVLLDNSIKELPDYQGLHVIQILDRVLLKSATALKCKKIILTTDVDLITDGVQAIDDAFLEWFVKNPSCERVEVMCLGRFNKIDTYKIIIPQEIVEKKACTQDVVDEAMRIVSGEVRQPKCVRDGLVKQETIEEAADKWLKENNGNSLSVFDSFVLGAKWQAERMYSDRKSS